MGKLQQFQGVVTDALGWQVQYLKSLQYNLLNCDKGNVYKFRG